MRPHRSFLNLSCRIWDTCLSLTVGVGEGTLCSGALIQYSPRALQWARQHLGGGGLGVSEHRADCLGGIGLGLWVSNPIPEWSFSHFICHFIPTDMHSISLFTCVSCIFAVWCPVAGLAWWLPQGEGTAGWQVLRELPGGVPGGSHVALLPQQAAGHTAERTLRPWGSGVEWRPVHPEVSVPWMMIRTYGWLTYPKALVFTVFLNLCHFSVCFS